jgi:alkanesulfonate monooxygenase SsuD/methylene tetrahydromethanopterin reductase-like flavin-dependent oxidoreductase (luciferase family)
VIILPQRQTALVAKQAAEVDVLSRGRLRLGVGVGWNPVEYEALGQDFHTRGRRCDEQIEVLRMLWTRPTITYRGRWHTITDAGINPLPMQRPIPIWIGGESPAAIRRPATIRRWRCCGDRQCCRPPIGRRHHRLANRAWRAGSAAREQRRALRRDDRR